MTQQNEQPTEVRSDNGDMVEEPLSTAEVWSQFLNSPGVQDLIRRLPDALGENAKSSRESTDRRAIAVMFLAWALVVTIVAPVTLLLWKGRFDPVGAAFLFGTIAGGIFVFLSRFFTPGR